MACKRLSWFFTPVITVAMALAVVGSATAEHNASHKVVALRRGAGAFGLFESLGELSSVFTDALPGVPIDANTPGPAGNGNITFIDNVVDDSMFWGSADSDSSGIAAGGSNTWDESREFFENNGATAASRLSSGGVGAQLPLLKFDVSQASGLANGTIIKAELRLFFDGGQGPGNTDLFSARVSPDKVGRITSFDWVEGNKTGQAPGMDITDPNGVILIPGAPGTSRAHPVSTITGLHRDINDADGSFTRTRGRWFDADGVIDTSDPNQTFYRTLLGSDYNEDGHVDGDDLERWEANYGSDTPPATGFNWKFPRGDDDVNGTVDGNDFLAWQRNAGKIGVGIHGSDPNFNDNPDARGWFGTENPGGGVTYQAPTWGDGNDYFNPYAVDYTTNPTDFPLLTLDGVQIYSPRAQGESGSNARYPVAPIDGVSPGDGDPNTEVDSLDASSVGFTNNFDYASKISEIGEVSAQSGFDVWDITEIVQLWASGADNFGLYVADNLRTFAMSETLHGLDFAPVLFIEYTTGGGVAAVPEPSSIVLLGLAGLAGFARRRRRA